VLTPRAARGALQAWRLRLTRLSTVRTFSSDAILRLFHGRAYFFVDGVAWPSVPGIRLAIGGNHVRDFDDDPPVSYAIADGWAEFAETVLPSVGGANYVTWAILVYCLRQRCRTGAKVIVAVIFRRNSV
jgi:hypothetical protein